jgi:hypothetical protein
MTLLGVDTPFEDGGQLRRWLVEVFIFVNLAFLAVDVYMAHSVNDFAVEAEWLPVYFSAVAPLFLLPGLVRRRWKEGFDRWAGLIVGAASLAVGVGGMILHLKSSFFAHQTLISLVYAAPFVAPLSYAGVGLLLLLNRTEHEDWGRWILFLALAGWVGNFGLSLLDHAQNGFFYPSEWISVTSAGFAVAFLGTSFFFSEDRPLLQWTMGVMGVQVVVGVVGAGLHLAGSLASSGPSLWYKIIFGAPVFAPLLFANLAALAAIGLWEQLDASAKSALSEN